MGAPLSAPSRGSRDLHPRDNDSFTYKAYDGSASSNLATVSITISEPPPNAAPSVPVPSAPANGSIVDNGAATFSWAPSVDPEGEALTYRVELFQGASLLASLISTTSSVALPDRLGSGSYTWRVEAVDARGASSGFSTSSTFTVPAIAPDAQSAALGGKGEPPPVACSATGAGNWLLWLGPWVLLGLEGRRRRQRA
jgi:hypothetical protein